MHLQCAEAYGFVKFLARVPRATKGVGLKSLSTGSLRETAAWRLPTSRVSRTQARAVALGRSGSAASKLTSDLSHTARSAPRARRAHSFLAGVSSCERRDDTPPASRSRGRGTLSLSLALSRDRSLFARRLVRRRRLRLGDRAESRLFAREIRKNRGCVT